jgi:hypothetical protein
VYFDQDPAIDFAWILFIGRARLGLASDREVMRLTLKGFMARYQAYQNVFDVENMLRANNATYAAMKRKQEQEEEWF